MYYVNTDCTTDKTVMLDILSPRETTVDSYPLGRQYLLYNAEC